MLDQKKCSWSKVITGLIIVLLLTKVTVWSLMLCKCITDTLAQQLDHMIDSVSATLFLLKQ